MLSRKVHHLSENMLKTSTTTKSVESSTLDAGEDFLRRKKEVNSSLLTKDCQPCPVHPGNQNKQKVLTFEWKKIKLVLLTYGTTIKTKKIQK